MRLDQYVAEFWPEYSRSTWQKLIRAGNVKVNGKIIVSPKRDLGEDDYVQVEEPKEQDFSQETLPTIYEDKNVIVLNKPTGVLTHAKGAISEEFTVAEFVRPKTAFKQDTNRPGIIHRLDRDTSGVILCVKNEETAHLLQKQFSNRTVKKTYWAVLDGIPREQTALVDLPIERNPKHPSQFRVGPTGKPAQTLYTVQKSDDKHSLVQLQPKTGRTHQLRVHMAYLRTPIMGDRVYGKEADRLYLHATSLEITLPGGIRTVFEAPLPEGFKEVVL